MDITSSDISSVISIDILYNEDIEYLLRSFNIIPKGYNPMSLALGLTTMLLFSKLANEGSPLANVNT